MNILTINLLFSTLVFGIAARLYLWPHLKSLTFRAVMLPILLLHGLRHLGLMFLESGAVYPGIRPEFAVPAALGDFAAALLALAAIPAVAVNARFSKLLVWVFNLEGTIDLMAAILLATIYDASHYMGPAYWIPSFWVPRLIVTHYITFRVLLRAHAMPAEVRHE